MKVLAADVGGTHTTLAVVDTKKMKVLSKQESLTGEISSFEQHVAHLQRLRDFRPIPCTAV